jgi:hypothetical protein
MMPRKRIIDPEFWSDEEIGQWSHAARLFYIGLWNFADDYGRFKAHNNLLKSQIFPYDVKINIENLKKELSTKVQWYETDTLQYGYIKNFLKYQRIDRPSDSKLPEPPPFDEHSTSTRRTLDTNIREVKLSKVNISKETKRLYLDFVLLTDKEHTLLVEKFGEDGCAKKIAALDDYIASKGAKYASHYRTILVWAKKDAETYNKPISLPQFRKCEQCGTGSIMMDGLCASCYSKRGVV